ncbi:hypothetical protein [Nocardioides conyzicola]|uniref:Lipoprotein n=1 Tax=Nocardioides conyzicola TaxID=1651781 RepID=A0ABP8X1K7_9ACTN
MSRLATAAALAGLVLALTGCNGSDPEADPTTSPSSSAASPSDSGSTDPSESSSPTVPAATGPLLKMPNATMNAPKGYKKLAGFADFTTEANPSDGTFGAVRLSSLEYAGPTLPLDLQVKAVLKVATSKMTRQDNIEIDGVELWHLRGSTGYSSVDEYGVRNDGYETSIDFEFQKGTPASTRDKVIAESLASFTWR